MSYRGHIEHGVVVFDEPVALADGVVVCVEPISTPTAPTLAERMKNAIGIAKGLPRDLAQNHDHYLHGKPKK